MKQNMKTFPILTTERLMLRQLSENDVHEIYLLRSDTMVNTYLGRQLSKTLEDALTFIDQIKSSSLSYWAIELKGSEKLIGTICLFDILREQKKCEIGYELLTEYQGKGIMQEAAKKIIEYSTQILGLRTINAYTHAGNLNSINLLKKLNFISTNIDDNMKSNLILYQHSLQG
jgi:ribosomal-protein-alanine N-acetyltransferase